jgi:hypothetical protein
METAFEVTAKVPHNFNLRTPCFKWYAAHDWNNSYTHQKNT